jgi:hypothetical protein
LSVSNTTPSAVSSNETGRTLIPALSRYNLILLAILVIQLAVVAYIYWPSQRITSSGDPLLVGVTVDNVTGLTITDNNDRSVSFVKEGDTWTVADTDGYPVREEKMKQTLEKLIAVTGNRLVTQTEGSHDRLQVAEDNYLRKVDVTTAEGTQTLYFGSSAGASATHVRTATEPATYLTGEIATWELDTLISTWIDVAYHRVPEDQITEVTLENAHGTFTFVRGESEDGEERKWTLADATPDEPVASANISTLISRISTLNLQSVLGKSEQPEYGLDNPLATITVISTEATTDTASAETKTTTILVGAKDEETNTYYLKSSDSEYYVRLASFTGDEFVNKQRSDLMIKTPASAEEDDATSESTTPEVDASGVTTETGEIEEQSVTTTTVESSEVTTDTTEIEDASEATDDEADVDATDVVTDSVESGEAEEADAETTDTEAEESEAEEDTAEEAE